MTPTTPLTCSEFVELVTSYLEGALAPEDRARFGDHLGCCDWCTTYLEQMRVTLTVVGHIDPGGLDPRVESEMLAAFRDWKGGGTA